jgi:hypothetical protein
MFPQIVSFSFARKDSFPNIYRLRHSSLMQKETPTGLMSVIREAEVSTRGR